MEHRLDSADKLILAASSVIAFAFLAAVIFFWPIVAMYVTDTGAAGPVARYLGLSVAVASAASEIISLIFVSRRRPLAALLFALGPLLGSTFIAAIGVVFG